MGKATSIPRRAPGQREHGGKCWRAMRDHDQSRAPPRVQLLHALTFA